MIDRHPVDIAADRYTPDSLPAARHSRWWAVSSYLQASGIAEPEADRRAFHAVLSDMFDHLELDDAGVMTGRPTR